MRISNSKKEKIFEQILLTLYLKSPNPLFTSEIAQEIARDEEFIKKLLKELKSKNLINEVKKNPQGIPYIRRSRWVMNDNTYKIYKNKQIFS